MEPDSSLGGARRPVGAVHRRRRRQGRPLPRCRRRASRSSRPTISASISSARRTTTAKAVDPAEHRRRRRRSARSRVRRDRRHRRLRAEPGFQVDRVQGVQPALRAPYRGGGEPFAITAVGNAVRAQADAEPGALRAGVERRIQRDSTGCSAAISTRRRPTHRGSCQKSAARDRADGEDRRSRGIIAFTNARILPMTDQERHRARRRRGRAQPHQGGRRGGQRHQCRRARK